MSADGAGRRFAARAPILFLNWRDMDHPDAGGAEVYCWEMARRIASYGHEVTLFAAQPPGTPRRSFEDGVNIIRRGGAFSVYAHAAQYLRANRHRFAAIVDCQNGIPFFAPLFAGPSQAVVAVIHHVHQEQFALHFKGPLRYLGRALEGPVGRWAYRSCPTAVVSPSTRQDVRLALGFRDAIYVVPNGGPGPLERMTRAAEPTITVVSRLVVQKQIDALLDAVAALRPRWPTLQVNVIGSGPERARLEARTTSAGVRFHGFLPHAEKVALLGQAWLTVNPSRGEGWGLNVIEANALGIPTVAFDVPGLRDSVIDGVTGWLVRDRDGLAAKIDEGLRALVEPAEAARWAARCQAWCSRFSWDDSADRLYRLIGAEIDRRQAGRATPLTERRRRQTDLTCVAHVPLSAAPLRGRSLGEGVAGARLRRTDLVVDAGDRVDIVLHGADEDDSLKALERVGASDGAWLRVAQCVDLLAGRPVIDDPVRSV